MTRWTAHMLLVNKRQIRSTRRSVFVAPEEIITGINIAAESLQAIIFLHTANANCKGGKRCKSAQNRQNYTHELFWGHKNSEFLNHNASSKLSVLHCRTI